MAFFNGWPWTNFQEQNIDWLIRELKAQGATLENLAQVVEDLKGTISQDVADILQEMFDDGSLERLIAQYMQHKTWMVNDITSLPADVIPVAGDTINTPTASYEVLSSGGIQLGGLRLRPNYYTVCSDIGLIGDGMQSEAAKTMNLMNVLGVVDLKGATILCNSKITIPSNSGLKNGTIVWSPSINMALDADTKSNIIFENMVFDMSASTTLGVKMQLVDSSNITIRDCEFKNWYGTACRLNGSEDVLIERVYAHDSSGATGNPGTAFYMQGGSRLTLKNSRSKALWDALIYLDGTIAVNDVIINGIQSEDHASIYNPHAISVYGNVSNISISDVVIRNCDYGIRIAHRAGSLPSAVTISNVSIYTLTTGTGIEILGDPDPGNLLSFLGCINNVQIYHAAQDGLYMSNIRGGEFSNMHISAARTGIRAINASYMLITSIYCALATNYDFCGMFFDEDSRGNMIIGCYLHKRSAAGTLTSGYQDRNVTTPYNTFALCKIQGGTLSANGFDCSHSIIQLPSGNVLSAQPVSVAYGDSNNKPTHSLYDGYYILDSTGDSAGWRYDNGNWTPN